MGFRSRKWSRTAVALIGGLVAIALLPSVAQAESSSSGVYHVASPKAINSPIEMPEPEQRTKPPGDAGTKATAGDEGGAESEERHQAGAAASGNGGDHSGGGGHGSGESASKRGTTSGRAQTKEPAPVRTAPPPTIGVPEPQGGGGSSPVLPILIAVAALAGLSVGVVVYRERSSLP